MECSHCGGTGLEPIKCEIAGCENTAYFEAWYGDKVIQRLHLCVEHIFKSRASKANILKGILELLEE